MLKLCRPAILVALVITNGIANGSEDSIGANGINSAGLNLGGSGVAIGHERIKGQNDLLNRSDPLFSPD